MESSGSALLPPDRRRRTRSVSTSSSSTTSSSSSILLTPSPSHLFTQTPFHPKSSSIPFSWEKTPGIPKRPSPKPQASRPIPLPPPLKPTIAGDKFDPFAVALVECAKDPPPKDSDTYPWIVSRPVTGRRGFRIGFGLVDLYGSCKSSVSVARSTVEISNSRAGAYRILNRRVG